MNSFQVLNRIKHPNVREFAKRATMFARKLMFGFITVAIVQLGLFALSKPVFAQQSVPVSAVAASSRFQAFAGEQNLISLAGMVPDVNAVAGYRMSASATNYASGYGAPNDETPLVHFDFGSIKTVNQFHVWNGNEPGYSWRGFRDVTIQFSNDGLRWASVPERVVFQQAPGADGYQGQRVLLARPISARFIRLVCNSTWRTSGNADVAALGRVFFYEGGSPTAMPQESGRFPAASGVINVRRAPYLAKGDGISDDTAALQQAINDWQSTGRVIYLPPGVYLVSAPLKFTANTSSNRNALYGRNVLRGFHARETTIRLRDNTFADAAAPQAVLNNGFISFWNGQFEQNTADWFHNSISDLTIDVGRGNPGAKGLEFFSNNTGSVRNVRILSGDGQGHIGLDLGHKDTNGPLLVKHVEVLGFKTGVRTAQTVNSQTFEFISLRNQTETAFDNNGQSVSIRGMFTEGGVTALRNRFGSAALIDSYMKGKGTSATAAAAVVNGEFLYGRNIGSDGFLKTIDNQYGSGPSIKQSFHGDYSSTGSALTLFPGRSASLRLEVEHTPSHGPDHPSHWANARDFRLTTEVDDGPSLQRAIDSGAHTVYIPGGSRFVISSNVLVRGNVGHLLGMNAGITMVGNARIRVVEGNRRMVHAESFFITSIAGQSVFEHATSRRFTLTDSEASLVSSGTGDLFLENVVGSFTLGAHRTWARQLNAEASGTKIINSGGKLWVLGLKTERAGTLVDTVYGGATEIIGGLCYTTTSGSAPMFNVVNSKLSVNIAEISYGGVPFQTLVREVNAGVTRELNRNQAPLRFSFLGGSALPLFLSAP